MLIIIIGGSTFEFWQNASSQKIIDSFSSLTPQAATVLRNGTTKSKDASRIVNGDVVLIKGGDRIPADLRIIECHGVKVDNSSLTGESDPQSRAEESTSKNPLETRNLAFFGSFVLEGTGKGIVVRTGESTLIGRIAHLASEEGGAETPLQTDINHFTLGLAIFSIVVGLIFFAISFAFFPIQTNLLFAIGIIVANVPLALPPTVTLSLNLTARRLKKVSVLAKHLITVETLGATSVICSDKTGTLTQNRMTVSHFWYDGQVRDANPEGENPYRQDDLTFKDLAEICTLCNRAVIDKTHKDSKGNHSIIGDASETGIHKAKPLIQSRKYLTQ